MSAARHVPAVLLILLAAVPALANAADMGFAISLATRIMIYAIAALSLDLILGYGAMVSFGHAAFVGIGAYAVGIASAHDLWEAALIGRNLSNEKYLVTAGDKPGGMGELTGGLGRPREVILQLTRRF